CLNELISLGYKVKVFEVGKYICWGTPNDYKTFLYWQSFFHKCKWHPYDLYNDQSVDKNKIGEIEAEFFKFKQEYQ
ncbi:MAG: hypothetical protein Q8880_09295, partial [Bacteroidota bacterium]|nr:hypothetical protein [Bacteroidota bacterium]